jgi:hypothetical protein
MKSNAGSDIGKIIPWDAPSIVHPVDLPDWAVRLFEIGLIPLPGWGGGKALPGTSFRSLADNPPSRTQVEKQDYSGGLLILLGIKHPDGGFTIGIDIDRGPFEVFPWSDKFLMLEAGTAPGKWHLYVTIADRLEGQIDLKDDQGNLVAEIKGYGRALRSWPTLPEGKPRSYHVLAISNTAHKCLPKLTAMQLAEALSDFLSYSLQKRIFIDGCNEDSAGKSPVRPLSEDVYIRVSQELERRNVRLKPSGKGWLLGNCPFHDDHKPSFSVSFEHNAWCCFAGCGSGSVRNLAWRLNVRLPKKKHHKPVSITAWEVRG